ncbi:MAG: hypothetical protein GEU79_16005 [Acidimicrobiia bacterium]|nr:hypothetical protein [Acidimicrobiia bacterium]
MVFELFRRSESQVESIEDEIAAMLSTAVETYQLATDALTRRVEPGSVGPKLRKRDKRINKVERAIRRQLVVHAGVRGNEADVPLLLVYMSIAKDTWDLAAAGADMSSGSDLEMVDRVRTEVTQLIGESARVFGERDVETAISVLKDADDTVDQYEHRMLAQYTAAEGAAARALFYRYAQRITAHLMNVLTAVVMPFERLDYWDEDKIDREL